LLSHGSKTISQIIGNIQIEGDHGFKRRCEVVAKEKALNGFLLIFGGYALIFYSWFLM